MALDKTHSQTGNASALPDIRSINSSDLKEVLIKGYEDFKEKPSHTILLVVIYPIVGLFLIRLSAGYDVLHLAFPLIAGFALIGPLAALALYELSRRREKGLDDSWVHVLDIIHSPSIISILKLSVLLGMIYVAWLAVAQIIFGATIGNEIPESVTSFAREVLTTPAGWTLIVFGCGVGFIFAIVVLAISAVSFPMLLDRDVSTGTAIQTSINALKSNPKTMLMWGLMVVVLLVAGAIPFFFGLAVVMPILGHSTWHLYRKVVAK
jgi:uncharacterized membrane protein